MGNQASMNNMPKMSSRFTLRGLSWRAPTNKKLPPLPGDEDDRDSFQPPPGGGGNGMASMRGGPAPEGAWRDEDSEWGADDDDDDQSSWKMSKRISSKRDTMRKNMASTMFEASQLGGKSGRFNSVRQSTNVRDSATVRDSGVSEWTVATIEQKGPEFRELHDKLVKFYLKHDPDAINNKEIDISGMTCWCLESEEGSLEELNEKLMDRFGENLETFEDSGRRISANLQSSNTSASSPFGDSDDDSDEEESDWETETKGPADSSNDVAEVRDQLERFFLQYEPNNLGDIEGFMVEFKQHGRMALNVKLYRAFGKDLTTLSENSAFSDITPESMGGTMASSRKGSVRKASKFGVHVAPDEVLGEMRNSPLRQSAASAASAGMPGSAGFPDFTRKREQKTQELRKQSNVSASLARKWKHLDNRSRGISTRISTRISTKFQKPKAPSGGSSPSSTMSSAASAIVPSTGNVVEGPPPTRASAASSRPKSRVPDSGNCQRFQINLEGEFGTCKNCGRKKGDHYKEPPTAKLAPTLARRWQKLSV